MAVLTTKDVAYRGFSGYEDPRYPSGFHRTDGTVIGDASGGDVVLAFAFARATEDRNSQYYSIEDVRMTNFTLNGINVQVAVVNFETSVTDRFAMRVEATQAGFSSVPVEDTAAFNGLFIGRQASPTADTTVTFTLDNVDGILLRVMLAGYVWSARSTAVPGGPQRPPTGLYRS